MDFIPLDQYDGVYGTPYYTERGSLSALEKMNHWNNFHILYEILRTSKRDIQESSNQKYGRKNQVATGNLERWHMTNVQISIT